MIFSKSSLAIGFALEGSDAPPFFDRFEQVHLVSSSLTMIHGVHGIITPMRPFGASAISRTKNTGGNAAGVRSADLLFGC